jgi:alpha-N-arabinofuranosidase
MLKPESNVLMANYWHFLNSYWGMITSNLARVDGEPFGERPGFPLYCLWARHLGDSLVATEVTGGPRAEFAGFSEAAAATGDQYRPRQILVSPSLPTPRPFQSEHYKISTDTNGHWVIELNGFTGNLYPQLFSVKRPDVATGQTHEYHLTFEAQFFPAPGSGTTRLGLGLGDSRGWQATHSAVALTKVLDPGWHRFHGVLKPLEDCPGVQVLARLEAGTDTVSGRLEIRNVQLDVVSPEVFPAYNVLTSTATLSKDGRKLALFVFNKSDANDIPVEVRPKDFPATRARYWEVNAPGLAALEGVRETVSGALLPVVAGKIVHTFPAHSMTVVEFERK